MNGIDLRDLASEEAPTDSQGPSEEEGLTPEQMVHAKAMGLDEAQALAAKAFFKSCAEDAEY